MPLIEVRYNQDTLHEDNVRRVVNILPLVASTALSCPEGGKLSEEDIMVEVRPLGPLDRNCQEMHIRVWAHDYKSRKKRIDEIQEAIKSRVRACIGDVDAYVWVLLAPTSYGSWKRG